MATNGDFMGCFQWDFSWWCQWDVYTFSIYSMIVMTNVVKTLETFNDCT